MKQSNRKTPAVFTIGLVLLCLVMFSQYMTGGLYARYVSTATASSGARVAKFDVSSTKKNGVDFEIILDFFDHEKQSDCIEFEVTSSSEVSVTYDLILILPDDLMVLIIDDFILVSLDDGSIEPIVDAENGTITFPAGKFNAAAVQSNLHNITFSVREGTMLNHSIEINNSATFRIHVEQID